MALLTHVDQVCLETAQDLTLVYHSRVVRDTVRSHGPRSSVYPRSVYAHWILTVSFAVFR